MHHSYLAALVLAAMGFAFVLADPKTPTSRALGAGLILGGLSIAGNATQQLMMDTGSVVVWLKYVVPTLDAAAIIAAYDWVARLRRTIPEKTGLDTRFGDYIIRVAQLVVMIYWTLAMMYPEERSAHFLGGLTLGVSESSKWFYLFTLPLDLSALMAATSMLLLLNRKLDPAEKKRLIAMCIAMPVMLFGYVLPLAWAPFITVFGAMILLVGAIQYHVDQGRRSEFLGRFLSPDVAELVRGQGLDAVRRETRTISVLHCDIRGFTNRCKSLSSDEILDLLRQFYSVVGRCCERHGATIKDYAGDGVMMLMGAPLPVVEPAERALELGRDLQTECEFLLSRWSTPESPLGLAVGIATGPVTLGVIGALRLEYVAVGATVNLAARLCESAGRGEILLDSPGLGHAPERRELNLKGFGEQIPAYSAA